MIYRKPDSVDSENALRASGDRRRLLVPLNCDAVERIAINPVGSFLQRHRLSICHEI